MNDLHPLLTVGDVAALLRVTPRMVYELAESRDERDRLPQVRIGRRLRFDAAAIRDYIDARAVPA